MTKKITNTYKTHHKNNRTKTVKHKQTHISLTHAKNNDANSNGKKININNIFFIHIPKTAGMLMEDIFYEYGGCVSLCYFNKYKLNKNIVKNKKYKHISLWHIPFRFIQQSTINKIVNNNIIFSIVRNPYERIISDYKFWVKYYTDRANNTKLSTKEKLLMKEIEEYIGDDITVDIQIFNSFVHKILNTKKYMTLFDGHYIPMTYYVYDTKHKQIPQTIIKMENMDEEFNEFIKKYELPIPLNITKQRTQNVSKGDIKVSDISNENIELINEIYADDFKNFKYEKL